MSPQSPYSEHELLQLLAIGDAMAFSHIFKEYYSALCHFAGKITGETDHAEDLVQDVFEKLWHKQSSFENFRHLKDFLYKATRNASLNFIKGSLHSKERQAVYLNAQDKLDAAFDLDIIRTEVFRVIYREISNLPEQSGKIVRMSYIEGLKNEEIAELLGLSIQTVKNQKSRGVSLLRSRLSPSIFSLLLLLLRQP